MSGPDLLTIKQVAEMLACHTMTVRRKMASGEFGPITRLGRKAVRISRAGVEAYISLHTEEIIR